MTESANSVCQLLDIKAENVRNALADHLKERAVQIGLASNVLDLVAEDAAQAVAAQLKLDVFELVFKAWAAVDELREYTNPTKHPPSECVVVRWGKCNIEAPQAVDVKLSLAGIALPVLRLTIDLSAEFHTLALTIRGGAIRKLTPGPARASVALKYRSALLIPARTTPEIKFERGIEFAEGLRIA